MGALCTRYVTDVIPDRDSMVQVIDIIVEFEELLKKGETLSKEQMKTKSQLAKVVREMRTFKKAAVK